MRGNGYATSTNAGAKTDLVRSFIRDDVEFLTMLLLHVCGDPNRVISCLANDFVSTNEYFLGRLLTIGYMHVPDHFSAKDTFLVYRVKVSDTNCNLA